MFSSTRKDPCGGITTIAPDGDGSLEPATADHRSNDVSILADKGVSTAMDDTVKQKGPESLLHGEGPRTVAFDHEYRYFIWPQARDAPPGWNDAGEEVVERERPARVDEHRTDMRPLNLCRLAEPAEHVTGNNK